MNTYQLAFAASLEHYKGKVFANSSDGYCVIMECEGVEFEFFSFTDLREWAGV